MERSAGILLHPSSIHGKYQCGELSKELFEWIDFLEESQMRYWQILPLNPVDDYFSPYASACTFAGNEYLISLDGLIELELLHPDECRSFLITEKSCRKSNFLNKDRLLKKAFQRFQKNPAYEKYVTQQKDWLDDYALFMSVKEYFRMKRERRVLDHPTENRLKKLYQDPEKAFHEVSLLSLEESLRFRDPVRCHYFCDLLSEEIEFIKFKQFIFDWQWQRIKQYANKKGISIIGDVPMYPAYDSLETWVYQENFQLDQQLIPTFQAAVPPDYYSEEGQLWGNPVYDWEAMKKNQFSFWKKRILQAYQLADVLRMDHFQGFTSYYSVPVGELTAKNGNYRDSYGDELLTELKNSDIPLHMIAEDLGLHQPENEALREKYQIPGMKVLQFGFLSDTKNTHLLHNFHTSNQIVYTGTHDNDTSKGFYDHASPGRQDFIRRYFECDGADISWNFIKAAYRSNAKLAIIPMQDILSLSTEARMNTPGTIKNNWLFRLQSEDLQKSYREALRYLAQLYDR